MNKTAIFFFGAAFGCLFLTTLWNIYSHLNKSNDLTPIYVMHHPDCKKDCIEVDWHGLDKGMIVYGCPDGVGPFQRGRGWVDWSNSFEFTGSDKCNVGQDCPPTLNSTGGMVPIEIKEENWK